jgi:hypothetical protein
MAKGNRTTSTPRGASVAKATKTARRPVEWGYENGQQVVVRAAGRWACDLPVARWRGLRDTISDMGEVVRAFDGTRDIADVDQRLTMLSMVASVARGLMVQAADDMGAVLALSPRLRENLAKADARMASEGGAQ